nr:MAG TPA_asm: hypothetical protein [Caudoviricetes sp.]
MAILVPAMPLVAHLAPVRRHSLTYQPRMKIQVLPGLVLSLVGNLRLP